MSNQINPAGAPPPGAICPVCRKGFRVNEKAVKRSCGWVHAATCDKQTKKAKPGKGK